MSVIERAVGSNIKAHIDWGNFDFRLNFVQWRRDGDLAHAVVSALEKSTLVPEGKIWIAVRDSQVTLKGQVDTHCQRAAAVMLTRNLPGVRSVIDSITVASLSAGAAASGLRPS
jgi:osmotically-inducible protein OsmY